MIHYFQGHNCEQLQSKDGGRGSAFEVNLPHFTKDIHIPDFCDSDYFLMHE